MVRIEARRVEDEPRKAFLNDRDINGDPIEDPETVLDVQVAVMPEDPGAVSEVQIPIAPEDPAIETHEDPGAPLKLGPAEDRSLPTAQPKERQQRRERAHHREWNPDTKRQKMREYMQEYRDTGKINERKTQTKG